MADLRTAGVKRLAKYYRFMASVISGLNQKKKEFMESKRSINEIFWEIWNVVEPWLAQHEKFEDYNLTF